MKTKVASPARKASASPTLLQGSARWRRGGDDPGLPMPAHGGNLSSTSRSSGGCRLEDLLKWGVKTLIGHPDHIRIPSFRDWESRTHRAGYDCSAARDRLAWTPCSNSDSMKIKGVQGAPKQCWEFPRLCRGGSKSLTFQEVSPRLEFGLSGACLGGGLAVWTLEPRQRGHAAQEGTRLSHRRSGRDRHSQIV